MTRRSIARLLALFAILPIFQSCQQACDVPGQPRTTGVRFLNAMAGVDTILVYVDSMLFDRAYYEITDTNLYPQTIEGRFAYRSKFVSGGVIREGTHHIVAISPSNPRVPLVDTVLHFNPKRQTVIFMGKQGATETPARALYLDDATRGRDETRSLARFVHTVTDLDTLDIYFSSTVKHDANGRPKPDLRIGYGQVSSEDGSGHGTGVSPSDYFVVPLNGTGLLITAAHDTSNVIFVTEYGFNSQGFFATVVVRGETKPIGKEPVVSSTVLADGTETPGPFVFSTTTFAVRLVNATHEPRLSLSVQGNFDAGPRHNVSLQEHVKFIQPDSVSLYWPLTPLYHGSAKYFLSMADTGKLITDSPWLIMTSMMQFNAKVNTRYTFVAIDTSVSGSSTHRYGIVPLVDTMSLAGAGKTRVRFFNASADHIANFTFGGKSFILRQGQWGITDAPLGTYDVTATDGTASGTMHFTLDSQLPMTIVILPEKGSLPFPVAVAHN
jgi:hypothetical protein